ncbi:MAG TPA: tetratricopeptide repeat protein [Polyangia bacterium]|nr:tetratricopeptide repeat protein [Polyangia bacterium]
MSTSAGSNHTRLGLFWAAALVGLCAAPSCVTTTEGQKMQADIDVLRTRLDEIDKRDREYKEQVIRLRKVLDEATALLTRNSADVGAKAAKSEQDIQAIQGRIEELAHNVDLENRQGVDARTQFEARLAALEQTQNKIVDRVAPEMPNDKDQLWTQAGQRLGSGQRDDGRRFYRVFIQRFPQDPRASQAHLAIGMSFVQESKYPNAAAEFQKVLQDYPASPEVPEAMWQLSLSFVQLRFCGDAKALLSDLVKRYPKSARAADARGELKSIAKLPKSSCTS